MLNFIDISMKLDTSALRNILEKIAISLKFLQTIKVMERFLFSLRSLKNNRQKKLPCNRKSCNNWKVFMKRLKLSDNLQSFTSISLKLLSSLPQSRNHPLLSLHLNHSLHLFLMNQRLSSSYPSSLSRKILMNSKLRPGRQ